MTTMEIKVMATIGVLVALAIISFGCAIRAALKDIDRRLNDTIAITAKHTGRLADLQKAIELHRNSTEGAIYEIKKRVPYRQANNWQRRRQWRDYNADNGEK